ncbi:MULTISPECIES: DUF5134 domain-containing protein [Streptomycetaceae]|uniref:Putative integral membrane protein n=1 Tax=Streptantibioticus cattleyicolor (strain ATCC 35852 / DSM 46488 / JCM 4925 / NBRC 14057 / NRRL 8057) TaxID=1003195 RepID=F8JW39_STREN|nr:MULTISPECIES: DUF5134 domain-containing protein [Streptomycetaceae]AEW93207.1 putative integral membrane protein [Streptantibioticus cattleyicolor NRRL 8057 = DSM 46488]MYS57931.1 DUF5134 domain-containing protein [Streptomyces sp. SID5468]CCB73570.1 putative integral membrane protein [Streptantibioticus cattleyicolor NRRL 8057 = DSM 46488]
MHGPLLVSWLVVAIGAATGAFCLLRPASRPGCAVRAEGLMGLGMGVMAVPGSVLDQRPWGPPVLAVAFGAAGLHALAVARRAPSHLHHVVGAGAMVYMALAMAGAPHPMTGPMAGMTHGMAGVPWLTALLLGYFAGYAIWTGLRILPPVAPVPATVTGPPLLRTPGLATACRTSMALAMVAMLLTM